VLAAWVVAGVLWRGLPVFRAAGGGGIPLYSALLLGWVLATQVAVLAACVALRRWRHELH
jgi:hypothetical protein